MNTREEALARLHKVVEDNPELRSYLQAEWHVKEKFTAFSDDTITRLDALFQSEVLGEAAIKRTLALIGTSQIKNLESVVRRIIIFAEVENHYTEMYGIRKNKPWSIFKKIEKYAHTLVCGVHNAVETPAQAQQMVSVFHAVVALVKSFATENNISHFDRFTVNYFMAKGIDTAEASPMFEVFRKNPKDAERLFDFVVSRGVVDPKLLEAVVFFGDDLPSAVFSGVL